MKDIGFKFVLPNMYPQAAPIAMLDEPEKADVIEMVDYLDKGNRIMFDYLVQWDGEFHFSKDQSKFNLMSLLIKVYNLFV